MAKDHNLTWGNHRKYPMLTECFQNVILGLVPSVWLLTSLPLYLFMLSGTTDCVSRKSRLYRAKQGLAVVQISIRFHLILELVTENDAGNDVNMTHAFIQTVELFALAISMLLVDMEWKRKYVTSAVLTIYWFLASTCGITIFYCKIMERHEIIVSMKTLPIGVACSILQLMLHCYAESTFTKQGEDSSPISQASFVNRLLYIWAERYLICGESKTFIVDDFDNLEEDDRSRTAGPELLRNWEVQQQKQNRQTNRRVSLFRVLFRTYYPNLVIGNLLRILDLGLKFAKPFIVGCLVGFADNNSEPTWKAFVYLTGYLLVCVGESLNLNLIWYKGLGIAKRMRAALIHLVFQKSLKLTNCSRMKQNVGDIVNLVTEDADYLKHWMAFHWMIWSVPIECLSYAVLLYHVVGNATFVAMAVLLLTVPLNRYTMKEDHKIQKQKLRVKGERIRLLTEVLRGIKILKLYAWELAFGDKVLDIRKKELNILRKRHSLEIWRNLLWGATPFLMAFTTLTTYVYLDERNVLTARTAFMAMSIFGALNTTFKAMPNYLTRFIRAYSSMIRLEEFFNREEIDSKDITHSESVNAITITDGQFTWNQNLRPCLKNINLDIPKGSLVAIVGKIGCGKSSLLAAILGNIRKKQGSVNVNGTTAYVPQQAWLQNVTLQNNILFGDPVRRTFYGDVIEACALRKDLDLLPAGEQTEIGEQGLNLSGGQKQRVSLARAIYHDADIYLLDDPLSAVDAHVGNHIFEHVISNGGLLKDKTRLFVTHGTAWLPHVDHIVVVDNGQITEQGHYSELLTNNGAFATFIREFSLHRSDSASSFEEENGLTQSIEESGYTSGDSSSDDEITFISNENDEDNTGLAGIYFKRDRKGPNMNNKSTLAEAELDDDSETTSVNDTRNCFNPKPTSFKRPTLTKSYKYKDDSGDYKGKLIEEEEIETGNVQFRQLKTYISALEIKYCVAAMILFIIGRTMDLVGEINLKNWTSDAKLQNVTTHKERYIRNGYYTKIYVTMGMAKLLCDFTYQMIIANRVIKATDLLHRKMLRNVLRSPISFFEKTPVGRIVQRFTTDMEPLDDNIDKDGIQLLSCILDFFKVVLVMSFCLPQFLVIIPPVMMSYYFIQKYFVPTKRQISRMKCRLRAPITSHLGEVLTGTSVIRAFSKEPKVTLQSGEKVDKFHELEFIDFAIERWVSVRLDFLNTACIVGTTLLAVLNRESLTGPVLGLAFGTSSLLHICLVGFVKSMSQLQKNVVCLEKMDQYSNMQTEAALKTTTELPNTWPSRGEIQIRDYSMRYRDGQDLVLDGIDVSIQAGEKIAIVGRTGAGKTSLTVGLFRLVEGTRGRICIDGVDIGDLGLFDLRSHLSILPQDPVLFYGTLRDNLDPLGNHTDEHILNALEHANLKDFMDTLHDKLDFKCGEDGQNLSAGQRQLICLTRSLLRKSKILVLDEATAVVDMETDELIQKTIKREYQDSTVITIAHRLKTIVDYDKVLVLDRGVVKEFDKPDVLLANPDSIFYSMAMDAGIV